MLFFLIYRCFICSTGSVAVNGVHPVPLAAPMGPLPDTLPLQSDHVTHPNSEASSSSSVSLSPVPSGSSPPLDVVAIFYNNIVKSRGVGICSSCFSLMRNVRVHGVRLIYLESSQIHTEHCRQQDNPIYALPL